MFKLNSIFKKVATFLFTVMVFTWTINSVVFAKELGDKGHADSNTEIITFDEGTVKYEHMTDDKLGKILKITNLDTNEEQLVFKDNNNIYLKNQNKEVLVVGNIEEGKLISPLGKSILPLRTSSDWTYFGPDRIHFDLEAVTDITVAAGIIALGIGGPVLAAKTALSSLGAGAVYNGVYADKWGKYRVIGRTVEGEYTSQLYQPNGRKLGSAIKWSGRR